MDKRAEFNDAMKEALKGGDKVGTATIRLIVAAVKDRDIELRGKGQAEGITDADILSMLQSMIKQRQESSKTYKDADRPELAAREEEEIEVVKRFLPKQMDEGEVKETVDGLLEELGVSDIREMGKVMAELKSRYAGKLDMSRASGMVKERLAG